MVLAIGVGASWTPWDELLAAGRAADHAAYQPTASERERREHVLARVATLIGRRGGPVLRVSLGETPDLRHPTSFEIDPMPSARRVRDGMDVGRLDELMEQLAWVDRGVTVRPVREGAPSGDWGTQRLYEFDGWEVGWITAGSVEAIAAGRTVAEAVEAALIALDTQD